MSNDISLFFFDVVDIGSSLTLSSCATIQKRYQNPITSLIKKMIIKNRIIAFFAASLRASSSTEAKLRGGRALQTPEECDTCYNVTTGDGTEYYLYPQWLNNSRDFIYCEMVWNYGDPYGSDLYSTSPIQPCNTTWWDNLNLTVVAELFGANSSTPNGPEYWSMDEVRVYASHPVDVLGEPMVYGASFAPGAVGSPEYTVFYPTKNQYLVWYAGLPTYQLTDADGFVYVLQGYKVAKDDLDTLGDQFQDLPEGWSYNVVTITEDLVFDLTPDAPIPSVQDEFDQIYIRIPSNTTASPAPTPSDGTSTDAPTSALPSGGMKASASGLLFSAVALGALFV